jgi:adenosylcobinamide-phosphate synthase
VHPVAAFGRLMQRVEARVYRDDRQAGSRYAATGVGVGIVAGLLTRSTTTGVSCAAAGRMLRAHADDIQRALEAGALDRARQALPALVGRDPSELDESGIAAAVIESVAENTVDAVVAPALWGAALGAPGALGYRAVNTMDAMVGHHSKRYERFGWCSARADDVAAYLPARVTAGLVCVAHPSRTSSILRAVSRDASAHPSPNAGVAEAAFAAALGLELGGKVRYGERIEDRPLLGTGPRPVPSDIGRATKLANQVELALVALLGATGLVASLTRRRQR